MRRLLRDSHRGRIVLSNNTQQPVTVMIPDAFIGVPQVQGQFGGGGGGGGFGGGGGGGLGGGGGGSRASAAAVAVGVAAAAAVGGVAVAAAVVAAVGAAGSACLRESRSRQRALGVPRSRTA